MKFWLAMFLALLAALPQRAAACSVCFGDPNSPAAQGLAMGVIALLGVVLLVLGGVSAFFIYLARRAAATDATTQSETNTSDIL
jgi:heme/copper-type cytochrome/quinol oxidase subunit 2